MPNLAPVYPEKVQIFLPGDSLPPHDRVAILAGSGNNNWSNRTQLMENLRRWAGELGANVVIIGNVEEASSGARIVGNLSGFGSRRNQDAIAILLRSNSESGEEITNCESLKRNMDAAFQTYEGQRNSANRETWQRMATRYHEECE